MVELHWVTKNTGKNILQTIIINKIEEGIKPPTGNGFEVFVNDLYSYGTTYCMEFIIDTGLEITLPQHTTIEVESLMGFSFDWSVLGMESIKMPKGRLLLKTKQSDVNYFKLEKKPVAKVWIVKRQVEKVRFLEKAEGGGRVVRGDAKIADSAETGSVEPREQISDTDTE
jgi:hypothetical protein